MGACRQAYLPSTIITALLIKSTNQQVNTTAQTRDGRFTMSLRRRTSCSLPATLCGEERCKVHSVVHSERKTFFFLIGSKAQRPRRIGRGLCWQLSAGLQSLQKALGRMDAWLRPSLLCQISWIPQGIYCSSRFACGLIFEATCSRACSDAHCICSPSCEAADTAFLPHLSINDKAAIRWYPVQV